MKKLCVFLAFLVITLRSNSAFSLEIDVAADAMSVLPDPLSNSSNVLIHFTLPPDVTQSRIIRATLWCGLDCSTDGIISAEARLMHVNWEPSMLSSTWLTTKNIYSEREATSFESGGCDSGFARCEVSRWVRAWSRNEKPNYGVLIRRIAGSVGSFKYASTGAVTNPTLKIAYMPVSVQ